MGWDYEECLTEIFDGFTILKQNRYICLGTRVRERDGSWMTFKRDGVGVTAPVLSHVTGSTTTDITPGIGQKVGSTKTYNHNGLKSVEAQSQSASSLSSARVNDAWGAVVSSTGTHAGRFGHGGAYGYQSDSNNLQLLGHRFYDPNAGRFLTRDRIKDGRNWYAYCENNPLTNADPEGLATITIRVTNKGVGHAWIIIRWDDGSVCVIENNMWNNLILHESGSPGFKGKVERPNDEERTLVFDEKYTSKEEIAEYVAGRSGVVSTEYNLTTNNCIVFAGDLFRYITGEDIMDGRMRTPGQMEAAIAEANKDGKSLGCPMGVKHRDRLSPSKRPKKTATIGGARSR